MTAKMTAPTQKQIATRQLAARRMVAQKLETMAGEACDLAADLSVFPIASSHLEAAAELLRKAVQCLVGPVDRVTLARKKETRDGR